MMRFVLWAWVGVKDRPAIDGPSLHADIRDGPTLERIVIRRSQTAQQSLSRVEASKQPSATAKRIQVSIPAGIIVRRGNRIAVNVFKACDAEACSK